ncbi:large conductance mechanosensitive channel protein MscL [Cutibacterium equinum]|uniref:Large conductance mechanosensitive channel protein MscL n=1 Tax=Cutibacterium equinum TaxID=3016342 RepID=A0ABY7QZA4_9ACTN|nr:large conductance mechanosensitive channel protein MscL [Cutibacterium equinum]WCC80361.1 large conductance mechanosensitive channel protein MscL [Cutibacterium equinum]
MKGFKDFLMRGNLIELAVAFILGGAFATVIKSFTTVIMDLLGKIGGTPNFSGWVPGGVHVGAFLTDLIAFVVMAFVIYFGLIKPVELASKKLKHPEEESVAAPTTDELLIEIRDELRSRPVQ